MALDDNVDALADAVGHEIKAVRNELGFVALALDSKQPIGNYASSDGSSGIVVGENQPTPGLFQTMLWVDTTGGNISFWIVT
jgi:hypothetical protein